MKETTRVVTGISSPTRIVVKRNWHAEEKIEKRKRELQKRHERHRTKMHRREDQSAPEVAVVGA